MMEHKRSPVSVEQGSLTSLTPKRHKAGLSISSKGPIFYRSPRACKMSGSGPSPTMTNEGNDGDCNISIDEYASDEDMDVTQTTKYPSGSLQNTILPQDLLKPTLRLHGD